MSDSKDNDNELNTAGEDTLAAMREAENGECEILDVEHFKEFVASL